jgi:hypothetical protein
VREWVLVFLGPVVDAFGAEEIAAAGALFGFFDNVEADGAVEHIALEVGK